MKIEEIGRESRGPCDTLCVTLKISGIPFEFEYQTVRCTRILAWDIEVFICHYFVIKKISRS